MSAHDGCTCRSPYDYSRVIDDTVDLNVAWLVQLVKTYYNNPENQVKVLFCSGRDDTCREDTERWLGKMCIPFDELFMRPADAKESNGNKLPDYKVKYQLFNENIRDKYNIRFVLDDRNQVVNLWRRLGLQCFQVAEGDF